MHTVGKSTYTAHGVAARLVDILSQKIDTQEPIENLTLSIRDEKINIGTFNQGDKFFYFVVAEIPIRNKQ